MPRFINPSYSNPNTPGWRSWCAGVMTAAQSEGFSYRHVVTRALGRDPTVQLDQVTAELRPGDRLLLCSDGLYRVLREQEIIDTVTRLAPEQAARALVDLANQTVTDDNVSAVGKGEA